MAGLLLSVGCVAGGLGVGWWLWRTVPGLLVGRGPVGPAVVAGIAAAGAAAADGAPTGQPVLDAVLRAALAAAITVVGARARRRGLVAAAGLTAAVAPGDARAVALSFAALGLAVAAAAWGGRSRLVGAVVSGLTVNASLWFVWPERQLATAALAGTVGAVLVGSAAGQLHRHHRRRLGALVVLGAVVAGGAAAAYGATAARARQDVTAAVAATEAGLDLAQAGDGALASERFGEALRLLAGVDDELSAWWARPARYVPVVAQQTRAIDELMAVARDVLARADDVVRGADVDDLQPRDGRVDVDAIGALEAPLARALRTFAGVGPALDAARSPWLVPQLARRFDELERRAEEAARDSATALDAVRHVPWLFGAGGERRWFVAVATPSELRGGGGFIGNWGILTATDGALELPVFERLHALYRDEPFGVTVDPEFDERYLELFGLDTWPQNVFASPHLPSSAVVARTILAATGYGDIDGVLVVDPHGVAALLELTGPIDVAGWPDPLTSENAAEVLLHRQYLDLATDREQFLSDTARTLFDALTSRDLPSPSVIGATLGDAVAQKRIQVHAFDREADGYLDRLGLDAELDAPVGDGLAVLDQNAAPSKIDWFLRRTVAYDVTVDAVTGAARATVEVRLRNTAPADLPDNGYLGEPEKAGVGASYLMTSLYTVLDLASMTVDGAPIEPAASAERGYAVHDHWVSIPPGGETLLRYELTGELAVFGGRYRLDVHRQPTVVPDDLVVRVNGTTIHEGPHDRDLVIEARL